MKIRRSDRVFWLLGMVAFAAAAYGLADEDATLLTPDQRAYRRFAAGDYAAAAAAFTDPMWQGAALFRQGRFAQAAGVFAGFDTAEAAFNQGNALVMEGQYDAAVARYERALELRPGWEPAAANRDIAAARAASLVREGGDMTGGRLEADEIVVSAPKSPPAGGAETTEGGGKLSDEELRAVWLRRVQTRPADFLRAKFAHQLAAREAPSGGVK